MAYILIPATNLAHLRLSLAGRAAPFGFSTHARASPPPHQDSSSGPDHCDERYADHRGSENFSSPDAREHESVIDKVSLSKCTSISAVMRDFPRTTSLRKCGERRPFEH
ncbi:hypothetical protein LIA77_07419 [Sarocladium implicatum]|nr:hypothetical protein LIA77_07419 [Sarocladium implicatum]